MAAILAAPVAIKASFRLRASSPLSHRNRIFDQAGLHMGLQTLTHHLAAKHINDSGQVQPAFIGSDIGGIAAQKLVECLRRKTPLHQVSSHR